MDVVWQPSPEQAAATVTGRFLHAQGIDGYDELLRRSVAEPEWFWAEVADWLGLGFVPPYRAVLDDTAGPAWSQWFVGGGINLAGAALRWTATMPDEAAVVVDHEDGSVTTLTWAELTDRVQRAAGALRAGGVVPGDRVALLLPYGADAVVAFLATAWLGAIAVPVFSGFGADAVGQRLRASDAHTLVAAASTRRKGRDHPVLDVVHDAIERARAAGSAGPRQVLVVAEAGLALPPLGAARVAHWEHALATAAPAVHPAPTSAEDPVLIAYTSGTTGEPKGAVHVHGGFTVKVAQEAAFQTDLQPRDTLCWVTDPGWIMGPWTIVGGLVNGATLVCLDGSPDHPAPTRLWSAVERHQVTCLGVSPTLIRSLAAAGALPDAGQLDSLRTFASTGEAWNPAPWWWLFDTVGASRTPIVNLSGGTEVGACLVSVNLLQGLKPTSVGGPCLGVAVDVVGADGEPLVDDVGELVVRAPWPSITRGLWNDADRYVRTYWARHPGAWVQGDWASVDDDGFWFLHGRSDDTLNIAGKRVGPTEFESVAVADPDVVSAAAVGIPHPTKGEAVAVMCVLRAEARADDVAPRVAVAIADALGPAFRPSHVLAVADLPRTRSAKVVRRAVRAAAIGADPGDLSTLENPESLATIPLLVPAPTE